MHLLRVAGWRCSIWTTSMATNTPPISEEVYQEIIVRTVAIHLGTVFQHDRFSFHDGRTCNGFRKNNSQSMFPSLVVSSSGERLTWGTYASKINQSNWKWFPRFSLGSSLLKTTWGLQTHRRTSNQTEVYHVLGHVHVLYTCPHRLSPNPHLQHFVGSGFHVSSRYPWLLSILWSLHNSTQRFEPDHLTYCTGLTS